MSSENTKRIAKNTAMLYIRMLLTMFVSLYTSRIVLNVLGVEDFGVYNVVGGVVAMFSFIQNSMTASTQRFLNFEMGKLSERNLKRIFSVCVTSHYLVAIICVIFIETLGLWLVKEKLVIPEESQIAALWVFHFSVASFFIKIFSR